jgi:hypothetical protein
MAPRVTKKQQAADCMERAQRELGKALSLLGGRVRSRPRAIPYPWDFIARQHLEIAMYRAQVAAMALAHGRGGDAVEKSPFVPVDSGSSVSSRDESVVASSSVTSNRGRSDRD